MMDDKIRLVDDTGSEKEFELVVKFDLGDKTYVLVTENEESDAVYPFFMSPDQALLPVEDEAELALVEAKYDEIMEVEEADHHHEAQTELIAVMDEAGQEKTYELVVSLDIEDKTYLLLADREENDGLIPFYLTEDGEGLLPVVDECEFAMISEVYEGLAENN